MEVYFKKDMLAKLGDFVLGKSSPLYEPSQSRVIMGAGIAVPNFSPLLKVITTMMTDEKMIAKYPLSVDSKKILDCTNMLQMMMNPSNPEQDFTDTLSSMCVENIKLSKKLARIHIKAF